MLDFSFADTLRIWVIKVKGEMSDPLRFVVFGSREVRRSKRFEKFTLFLGIYSYFNRC